MLQRAFPSSPVYPPRYELKIKTLDGRLSITTWCSVYPAKKFLEIAIGNRDWVWINRRTISCADLTIKSRHLERFITHKFTEEERAWMLPYPYPDRARAIGFRKAHTADVASSGTTLPRIPKQGKTELTSPVLRTTKRRLRASSSSGKHSTIPKVEKNKKPQPKRVRVN